jgi:hypothetical protein
MNPKDQTFTKGPWSISTDNRHIEAPGGYLIAENYNHAPGYMVNLHLIAAAPELYEALTAAMIELEIAGENADNTNDRMAFRKMADRAHAVLAKASES